MVAILIELTDVIVKKILPSVLDVIRIEISALIFKTLLGIVVSSILIFSIFQLAIYYMEWAKPLEGESLYPFLIFGLSITLCITALYILFKRNGTNSMTPEQTESENPSSLLLIFGHGFLEGFHSKRQNRNNE